VSEIRYLPLGKNSGVTGTVGDWEKVFEMQIRSSFVTSVAPELSMEQGGFVTSWKLNIVAGKKKIRNKCVRKEHSGKHLAVDRCILLNFILD